MLKNNLKQIPQITLLRSDKVFMELLYSLIYPRDIINSNEFESIFDSMRDFYPNSYRIDEIELSISQEIIKNSGIEKEDNDFKKFKGLDFNFNFLDKVFDEFLEINGSKIYAKEYKLTEYIKFITKVNPYQIIGYKLAKYLNEYELEFCDILAMIDGINPLGYNKENEKYADNHLHLKGATYSAFNLTNLFNRKTQSQYYKKGFIKKLPRINEFSFINNSSISIGQIVDIIKVSIDYMYGVLLGNREETKHIERLQKIVSINQYIGLKCNYSLKTLSNMKKIVPFQSIYGTFANNLLDEIIKNYRKGFFDKAHLLENILFFYLFLKSNRDRDKLFFKLYLQGINILRSFMVMSQNLGLASFSEFSRSDIREVDKDNAKNIAKSIISSGTTYLNAKFSIKESKDEIFESILYFKNAFDREKKQTFEYNFCLSTTKQREELKRGRVQAISFLKERKKLKRQAKALDELLRSIKYKRVNEFNYLLQMEGIKAYIEKEKIKDKELDISNYIVSIDAVGKETLTPPEVFAPFFRYLRREPKSLKDNIFKGMQKFSHHPKLLITAHAGEDFNHILTGLRRIDEVINFFDLKRKDRLGHALALGLKPKYWRNNIKEIILTKGEDFDNLVWFVYHLNEVVKKVPEAQYFINKYRIKIFEYFRELYPSYIKTPQLGDLFKAWQLRKNCPMEFMKFEQENTLFGEYSNSVFDRDDFENKEKNESIYEFRDINKNEIAKEIYRATYIYPFNKKFQRESKKVIKIDIDDKEFDDELEIIEALQDYLITKYSKIGIIIEVNPSSNLFISSIGDYSNHPIFRFHPPKDKFLQKGKKFNRYGFRKGIIGVCVNSDDPAIFVTTLQNEFKFIKNSAIKDFNCSDREANIYVNELREYGINVFNFSYK